jgi:HD-GYP domain-containing protein (c-di-GMP phosphodiesterase class II)/Flp pilus assembly protein TadD
MAAPDPVLAALEKSLLENPANYDARIELATTYMTRGDYYSAAAELQKVVKGVPPDKVYKEAYYQLGLILRTLGNFSEAKKCMDKVLLADSKDGNALYYSGLLLSELGDLPGAAEALRNCIVLLPNQSYLHYTLGNVLLQQGLMDEGMKELLAALELSPKDTQPRTTLGLAYLLKGAFKDAARELSAVLQLNPKDSTAIFLYAWAQIKQEGEIEALEKFEKYVNFDQSNAQGHITLSALHYLIGEYPQGEEARKRGVRLLKSFKDPIYFATMQVLTSALKVIAEDKQLFEEEEVKAKKDMERAFQEIMELKDPLLREKSKRIARLAEDMAKIDEKFDEEEVENIRIAGSLCNLGMAFLPDAIISKEEKLTDDEKRVVTTHPLQAIRILQKIGGYSDILPIIKHHHERYNGTGYPDRLKGNDIPVGACIVGVADFFVELTLGSKRQKPASKDEVIKTLQSLKDNFFPARVVDLLVKAAKNP